MSYSAAEQYLIDHDPIMAQIIDSNYPLQTRSGRSSDYFASLARSIIGQQISTHSAAATYARFEKLSKIDFTIVVQLSDEQFRSAGLSRQKTRYLRELAQHFIDFPEIFMHLDELSDQAVIEKLTTIVGIGIWTAQMFLMFTLGRPDVFAPGDRGLQQAIDRNYPADQTRKPNDYAELSNIWQPYRTTACLYLWQSLHNTPIS